jgi:predicted amidohydrolase
MPASAPLVAVCQFAPTASRGANRASVSALVAEASSRGAGLIVLPEYSSCFADPMDETLAQNAETLEGEFVQALHDLARTHGVVIVAGMVEQADAGRVRNTLVAVSDAGIQAVYRKQHLYDAFGQTESDWIEPGPLETATFEALGIRFGMMTCYDLRFPEVARTLMDAGADALIVPAEWVRGPLKEHHWSTLLTARAIESTAYMIAADHPAPIGVGLSQIVDPQGVVLAGVSAGEGIALAPLDAGLIARTRETNPVLRLRRYRVVPND